MRLAAWSTLTPGICFMPDGVRTRKIRDRSGVPGEDIRYESSGKLVPLPSANIHEVFAELVLCARVK